MTGIADIYIMLSQPQSKEARLRFWSFFQITKKPEDLDRFVLLSWKRSGSNLLSGILHLHPEIIMHDELFNPTDIFTYHPKALLHGDSYAKKWSYLARDLHPKLFLQHIWSGCFVDGTKLKPRGTIVGFKSFPDHWKDVDNEDIWREVILDDPKTKKIILSRDCELSTYVSMKRAEITGSYLTRSYPKDLKVKLDVAAFQAFVNNYRFTFQRKYKSPLYREDTFYVTYEQLADEAHFNAQIAPKIFSFLGVDPDHKATRLGEVVKQSPPNECIENVIENWDEVERVFRHSDISYFQKRKANEMIPNQEVIAPATYPVPEINTWSILLPICSRVVSTELLHFTSPEGVENNRFACVEASSKHTLDNTERPKECWDRLQRFADSFVNTTFDSDLQNIEFIVGIDEGDNVFDSQAAREKVESILKPCNVRFVSVHQRMFGKVCRIWSHLGGHAKHDFVVLMGDDIELLDKGWKQTVERRFTKIHHQNPDLPFGAACVAFNDVSFPGFPTFPVVHRFHLKTFKALLPRQFVNQGGDPFLYALYSRFNASSFVSSKLRNTLGGDSGARYLKHDINWKGQILSLNLLKLQKALKIPPKGVCLDVVIPSYRINNNEIINHIVSLRSTIPAYISFWIIVDNPDEHHVFEMKKLAKASNKTLVGNNRFVTVVHYGENRGASSARNTGYNYSTADWVLFLDDDVIPDASILDAYISSIARYPKAKCMVGLTKLPPPCNSWTKILRTCNVMYFYGISKHRINPPWGVTANLMVKGSRHNHTVQFKHLYPKTGGGEDIDFVFQLKEFYKTNGCVVAVPEAVVHHPWWNKGRTCYGQICGWANGDSQVLTEWPEKTFLVCPNWIESIFVVIFVYSGIWWKGTKQSNVLSLVEACGSIAAMDHLVKVAAYYGSTKGLVESENKNRVVSWAYRIFLALGASTVISAQEITRAHCFVKRGTLFSFARRVDWFDGQAAMEVLDQKLRSGLQFVLYGLIAWYFLQPSLLSSQCEVP
jgi:hypothetical protein